MILRMVDDLMTIFYKVGFTAACTYAIKRHIEENEITIKVHSETVTIDYNNGDSSYRIVMGRENNGIQTNEKTE